MDIVTHGMMGMALAAPWLGTQPAIAVGFVLGSALPDLDAFSRCFGKRAFLQCHQTWTHSLPVIATSGLTLWLLLQWLSPEWSPLAVGLSLGATWHALIDLTNTYGVRLLAPFSSRRYCWEWMFFIDSVVIVMTITALIPLILDIFRGQECSPIVSVLYASGLLSYIGIKALMRVRARRWRGSDVVSIIPSAMWPWRYFVCERASDHVALKELNAVTGKSRILHEFDILDGEFRQFLNSLAEFQTISSLSPAYHVVNCVRTGDRISLECRDLRIINFATSFGQLDVTFNSQFEVLTSELHV